MTLGVSVLRTWSVCLAAFSRQTLRRLFPFIALALMVGCQPAPGPSGSPAAPSSPVAAPSASSAQATPDRTPSPAITPAAQAEPVDVIIVGAGLSGLTTAYNLKKAGISFRVLELTPRVGGRARTGSYPDKNSAEVGLAFGALVATARGR